MKKIINIFLVIALALPLLTGCEDFLDQRNYLNKDESNFPLDERDINQMVTGVYAALNIMYSQARFETSYWFVSEVASDDRFGGGGANTLQYPAIAHLMYSNIDMFNPGWNARYTGISRANQAIRGIERNVPPGRLRDQRLGEVKFLRALFYYELVFMFGDVPLVLEPPESVIIAREAPGQATQEEIFRQIGTDLWNAYSLMHDDAWNTERSGTATKWAAAGLLARVWMFYTGFYQRTTLPREGGEITRDQLIAVLENLINNSRHELVPDFHQLWDYSAPIVRQDYPWALARNIPPLIRDGLNPEHVFVVKHHGAGNQRMAAALWFGLREAGRNFANVYPLGVGWGTGPVNSQLWDQWLSDEPDDLRREASIWWQGNPAEGLLAPYQWGLEDQIEETGFWQKKYVATTAYGGNSPHQHPDGRRLRFSWHSAPTPAGYGLTDNFQNVHAKDFIYIRYADVLLMHSELTNGALISKYGMSGMNKVRDRVNLPPREYTLENLKRERRHELAFEGRRWGDIRRWRIAEQVLPLQYGTPIHNAGTNTVLKEQSPGGLAERYRVTQGFFWKPQTQIDLADGRLLQNPGWTVADGANFVVYTQ